MFSNAGSLLDRLQGIFSKGFLIAGIVPLVLLFIINWGLLYFFFRPIYLAWFNYVVPPSDVAILYWIKVILILFVGGLVLWNLNPWFRQFLEGRYLFGFLRNWLTNQQRMRNSKLWKGMNQLEIDLNDLRSSHEEWTEKLGIARQNGNRTSNIKLDKKFLQSYQKIKNKSRISDPLSFSELKAFFTLLHTVLSKTSVTEKNSLDAIHVDFVTTYENELTKMEHRYDQCLTSVKQQFPEDEGAVGPTSMYNYSQVHRQYGIKNFGFDIEYFWIRILKIIRADAHFSPMLEEAKNQLDFSVAFTIVLGISTCLWIPLSLCATGFWPFLLVGFFGPVFTTIAYQVTVQSYRGFSEFVRSAIDLFRFDLLKTLHIELPLDNAEEAEIWRNLITKEKRIEYLHPA